MRSTSIPFRSREILVLGTLAALGVFALAVLPAGAQDGENTPNLTDEVRVSHILVGSEDEAFMIRNSIVDDGGDISAFAKAARRWSKDVATKILGGRLQWFGMKSNMDPKFAEAAFSLSKGEISEPVNSQYGWHLIYLEDRREKATAATQEPPTPTKKAGPDDIAPGKEATPPVEPDSDVEPERLTVVGPSFKVTLMTIKSLRAQRQQFTFLPREAIEVHISAINETSKTERFFAPGLLPLGLRVMAAGEATRLVGDFSSIEEPESFLVDMNGYAIQGQVANVSEYFGDISRGRYRIAWDINSFFSNLETRFPAVKDDTEYTTLKGSLRAGRKVTPVPITRDVSPARARAFDLTVSVFDSIEADKKYYAQILLATETEPVTIELNVKAQTLPARHFANLALEGFYDNLNFFEVEPGNFLLGGCPLRTGTGAPNGTLPSFRNTARLEHKRGTVSFVSRNIRSRGPVAGGQVGSIFMVCLKDHPEWDDEHVPFGTVISGMDILDKIEKPVSFRKVTILTEAQYRGEDAAGTPDVTTVAGNPEAIIKTSKGDLTVTLYEDTSRNTAINFVSLAEDGFYGKTEDGEGKQEFFFLQQDENGKRLLIQTGSPTNDFQGGPGYKIKTDKSSARKCVRGALAMAVQTDPENRTYLPDTAGSQFFICLSDLDYLDYQPAIVVFGQVTKGLDVLSKLEEGDTLESIEITKKKSHSYTPQKVR